MAKEDTSRFTDISTVIIRDANGIITYPPEWAGLTDPPPPAFVTPVVPPVGDTLEDA